MYRKCPCLVIYLSIFSLFTHLQIPFSLSLSKPICLNNFSLTTSLLKSVADADDSGGGDGDGDGDSDAGGGGDGGGQSFQYAGHYFKYNSSNPLSFFVHFKSHIKYIN